MKRILPSSKATIYGCQSTLDVLFEAQIQLETTNHGKFPHSMRIPQYCGSKPWIGIMTHNETINLCLWRD